MMTRVLFQGILALSSAGTAAAFVAPTVRHMGTTAAGLVATSSSRSSSSSSSSAITTPFWGGASALSSSSSLMTRSLGTLKSSAMVDSSTNSDVKPWKINLLYDGKCSLCMKEVSFLQKRDMENQILFTDLNDPDFKPEQNGGVDYEAGMKYIHAVLPNGEVVKGVEVFRRIYEVIGLGWVYAATKIPFVGAAADWAYDQWAIRRLQITGRPDLEVILRERQEAAAAKKDADCEDKGECEIDWDKM